MARPQAAAKPSGKAPASVAATGAAGATHPVRQTVVLRPGPPPRKRGYKDIVAGVIGLILLIASGVLAVQLPKVDVLPPQFKVSFMDNRVDVRAPGDKPFEHYFNISTDPGRHHTFEFNVTDDDVTLITINVFFKDDLPASDPDKFRMEFYDPDGNSQPPEHTLANPVPRQNASNPATYDALQASATYTWSLRSKPDDTVIEAPNATADEVALEQERLNHFTTHGTWQLKVFLSQAGDCPAPTAGNPNSDDALRGAACVQANSGQGQNARKDPGNLFTVGSFSYVHFTVLAEGLD